MISPALERFLKYIQFDTQSAEAAGTTPSTPGQLVLASVLRQELDDLDLQNVRQLPCGYVLAELPASEGCEAVPAVGLLAHVDTSPAASGANVNPQIITYTGGKIPLGNSGLVLDPDQFPHLNTVIGKTLVTTDGTTLLGSDDKAGIAAIMTLLAYLKESGVPHGKICVGFTVDEEVGDEAKYLDVAEFGADFAYTVDGSIVNRIGCENFNAASAEITFAGVPSHPGTAKGAMVNALRVLTEFSGMLPAHEVPEETEKMEGFYHLCRISGDSTQAECAYLIRDFDTGNFAHRKQVMKDIAEKLNEKYGKNTVTVKITDTYLNMASGIRKHPHVLTLAEDAIRSAGLTPVRSAIRGGTDGAALSHRGLPCPNLGTGGHNCHGVHEYLCAEELEQVVEILKNLIRLIVSG